MNRPTRPPRSTSATYPAFRPVRRVRLHGWARASEWARLHYLRDGAPICGVDVSRSGLQLVGSAHDDDRCTRCVALLVGGVV